MITLTSDVADLILQRTLNENTLGLNKSIERMTSGYKINNAKDNAANYSISVDLSKKISSMLQIQNNTDDGIAMLQTAEGGLAEIQELLERLRALSNKAANGVYDEQSRNAMQEEADAITEEIARIRATMQYNGLSLYETPKEETSVTSRLARAAKVNNINDTDISLSDGGEKNSSPSDISLDIYTSTSTNTTTPTKSKVAAKSSASPQAKATSAPVASGAESFAANETRIITFDEVTYEITNKNASANDISFSKDENGQVTFRGSNFRIEGQKDVEHNILINGNSNYIIGGDLDDHLESTTGTTGNNFYGGKGDDTIISNSQGGLISGDTGNDNITSNASGHRILGGDDDDIININSDYYLEVWGESGNDTFNITKTQSNAFCFYGGDGDDVFNIIGDIQNIFINGDGGTNTFTGNISSNTLVNVVGGNASSMRIGSNETRGILINNIEYEVSGKSFSQDFIYKILDDGTIEFSTFSSIKIFGSSAVTIKGDPNKQHKVNLRSNSMTFYGGNKGDNIKGLANNQKIYTGDGNNNISLNNSKNTVTAGNGDNKIIVNSSNNTITAGSGNNTIGIQGDNNNVTTQNAKGTINIIGDSNTISNTRGENDVVIKGDNNKYSSVIGKKDITITGSSNEILTGAGNDKFTVKGDSNTVESTSGENEFVIRGNSNNVQGGSDIDDIKLNGNSNIANGGDSSDKFMVSGGNNNTIDGEAGERNTLIDNGRSTTYTNAVDITPRPFEAKIKVDIGSGEDKYVTTSISFNLFDFHLDFSTNESAREGLEKVDEMIKTVQEQILNIGTSINRLQYISEAQALKIQNLISTRSTLRDADIADESSAFIRSQILQQASATLLASSRNLKAQNVLGLLQGLNS